MGEDAVQASAGWISESLLRSLVWTDYRLAVLFTVFLPLTLLIWAFVQRSDVIQRLLIIYWRVASLLAITVYLMIPGWRVSFIAALMAHALIPISLWFWVDLNEELDDLSRSSLKLAFTSWRWATTVYMGIGLLFQIPFLRCAFADAAYDTQFCQVWFEAPQLYREYFHSGYEPGFLGFIGATGLVIYLLSLIYFVFVRLGKQGRSAIQN